MDKTLKDIGCVRLDDRKVVRAPGPKTKYIESLFCRSINYKYCLIVFYLVNCTFIS